MTLRNKGVININIFYVKANFFMKHHDYTDHTSSSLNLAHRLLNYAN